MPLFRSHASRDTSSKRTDLERQIGCIAGFFQIFDQQQRKQIAGPQQGVLPPSHAHQPHAAESPSTVLSDFVPEESDSSHGQQCTDAMVNGLAVVQDGDDCTLIDAAAEDLVVQGWPAAQPEIASNADSSSANCHSQVQEKLHRLKTAPVMRGEVHGVREMARHRSFNQSREMEEDFAFSLRRGNARAYAACGRRFTDKGMSSQGRLSVDAIEEVGDIPREEERWGFWSSPASQWPSGNGNAGHQGRVHDVPVEDAKGAWLSKGGRAAERHWAAEDSLEDWKQSLRALARLREDGESGVSSSYSGYSGCSAPKPSPSGALRNELPPASPARASAFDFKEAIRWSQRASTQAESSRRSWDDRDLPRSIAELRDAIHARSRLISAASPPPSPRPPSVVARLMGLDDLPKPSLSEPGPLINHRDRKPSGEAKLLQQLLQYSPPSPPPSTLGHPPLPPSPTVHSRRGSHVARPTYIADSPTYPSHYRDLPMHSELKSMLKQLEAMSLPGSIKTSSAKFFNSISTDHAKLHETTGRAVSREENVEPLPIPSPVLKKKSSQQGLPVVVLKQSEEIRSHSPRNSDGFHDEIESRLRQLGLQSSEQERKTLKQILEAMQLKGLLRPPDSTNVSIGTRRQQASSRLSGSASPAHAPSDGISHSWPSSPTSKSAARSDSKAIRPTKNDAGASIVIMRPLAKSTTRAPASVDDQRSGSERAVTPASRAGKVLPRKPKNAFNAETNTLKESGGCRAKSRSSVLASPHTPVQTRKLSLKIRQGGQVHIGKGSSRAASSEQTRKSGSELDAATSRHQENALCKASGKPMIAKACERSPSNVPSSDEHIISTIPDTLKPSKCFLVSSGTSLDADTSQATGMIESDIGTPPRELKADHNFGENVDCFLKEVVEQCSPVSVLDIHLSDNEAEEDSPKFTDATESIRDIQEDIGSCSLLLEEFQVHPEAPMCMQPVPPEMYSKEMVEEACLSNVDLPDATQDIMQNREQVTVDLLYMEDDFDCVLASSVNDTVDVAGAVEGGITDGSGARECLYVACEGNGACMHIDVACGRYNYGDCMHTDDACGGDEDNRRMDHVCVNNGDHVNMNNVSRNTGDCIHIGGYTDEVCTSNTDFCYTEDVLRAAGLIEALVGGGCAADGWLAGGGEMRREVYDELEVQWDAVHAEEEEGHIEAEDRDMGGELYRKSQQASMRRRLIFDCLNEIVEGRLSWLGLPGACGVGDYHHLPISSVWGDLQRLEQGPCSAEDSMYAMLEQDLLHDADYSIPFCWRGMPTQLATVALHLENDIFDSLVLEIFS